MASLWEKTRSDRTGFFAVFFSLQVHRVLAGGGRMAKHSLRRRLAARVRHIEKSVTEFLDLPPEAALDLPRLTLVGNSRLLLENHRGIVTYKPDLVKLKLTAGELEIKGTGLFLREIKPDAIALEGTIRSLEFC
ncbi:Flp pilus assembly protein, ATPase CpaF [Moorella thermoacetica Y72]|uniref:Flp pilus assembly protein, ATPase CpaF n=2 Tax=Neomoorella thermoacetica TaxID=1525 RepID=A0A0S6UG03_NEOTH|nr:Flp pilus assembly protein, ATPase CpaF [Moorella thermoacetica Y72]